MLVSREEIINCPRCNIPMVYDKEKGFWKCPFCDGEFWDSERAKAKQEEEAAHEKWLQEQENKPHNIITYGMSHFVPLPAGVPVRGKGGNKSGRKRKKPLRRAPRNYLYT